MRFEIFRLILRFFRVMDDDYYPFKDKKGSKNFNKKLRKIHENILSKRHTLGKKTTRNL